MCTASNSAKRPLAFIYDRHATTNTVVLELRLAKCAEYAEAKSWQIGGWFLDKSTDALTNDHRPAFDAMLNVIQSAGVDIPRVCLVHDWHRISRDEEVRGLFTRRVIHLGAGVETCDGEQRRPDGTYVQRARLTTAPIAA